MPAQPYGRRTNDLPWFCKISALRWVRKVWPAILIVGGFAWGETVDWVRGIPSKDKVAQYDKGLSLIPDFYRLQSEVVTIKREIADTNNLSASQRAEILHRLDVLDERLTRWFEKASGRQEVRR